MINKVILVGNVGKDPEVKAVGVDKVANFSIATTEKYKDKNGEVKELTEWHNIVIWGSLAEIVKKYVKKGSQVYIEGKIRTRNYDDKDGNKRYTTEILGNTLKLLGHKPSDTQPQAVEKEQQFTEMEDDLPF